MTEAIQKIEEKTGQDKRLKIVQLQAALLTLPQVEIPIKHHFAPGLYLREMFMPKDTVITGKVHKTEHYCILASGTVAVADENGSRLLSAPYVLHSMPGTKRALHSMDDCVWINVHHNPTNEKSHDKIDEIFVVDTFEQFLSFSEANKIEEGK